MADERQQPKQAKTTEQRLADVELQLAQTRATTPGGTIPEHAAGYGEDIEETWSLAEQEAARAEASVTPSPSPHG
jgi:hypothetical protein